jgi:hypothetical protein
MNRSPYNPRIFMLRTEEQRERVLRYICDLPLDQERPLRIMIDDPLPKKSREQEEKYHAMIGDIARQFEHCGKTWSAEDMKRLLVDQFRRDTFKDPDIAQLWQSVDQVEMAPSLDGSGVVVFGVQTRRFPVKLAAIFIEWLYAFGSELNIQWSQP